MIDPYDIVLGKNSPSTYLQRPWHMIKIGRSVTYVTKPTLGNVHLNLIGFENHKKGIAQKMIRCNTSKGGLEP